MQRFLKVAVTGVAGVPLVVRFATVCVLGVHYAASAKMYYDGDADSFEEGTNGMPVASYKTFYDDSGAVTDAVWLASENDASKLVGTDAGNVAYVGPRPMYGAATDRVLELDTGVGSLTRRISGNGLDCLDGPVYIDMLTQFVPFEEPPVITDESVKFAVYLNAQSNLVVYHGDTVASSLVTDVTLDPAFWYRLSIRVEVMLTVPCGRVFIDGSLVTSSAAYFPDGSGPGPGGFLFPLASEETVVQAVSFAGNGRVDELRMFDNDLIFYGPLLLHGFFF